ncbi:MAG: ABC transporter ATP-binding protein [Eubacterium sp.]|nr:ABC transporter ATP-binding protein [Eubacterium sp.]
MSLLEVRKLEKAYGEKKVLSEVSFQINPGEVVGLIGRNGAGKTTILKSISGLMSYNSGNILYKGKDIGKQPELIRDFGILIECAFLDYISAYDNLKVQGWASSGKLDQDLYMRMDEVLRLVDLYEVRKKKTKAYSFGMKQRLGLAQAILTGKGFLMLDEPFIGLDPVGKEVVKTAIIQKAKEENLGILFSSHDLPDVADICDRVIMLENGYCTAVNSPRLRAKYAIVLKNILPDNLFLLIPQGIESDESRKILFLNDQGKSSGDEAIDINVLLRFLVQHEIAVDRITFGDETLKQMFNGEEK